MVYLLFGSLVLMLVFFVAWQKAKADISFLEGKTADFLDREGRWMKKIEMMKLQLLQSRQSHPVYSERITSSLDITDSSWVPDEPDPVFSNAEFNEDPRDLQVAELGNISFAFLEKLGVNTAQPTVNEAVEPIAEMVEMEQTCFFEEKELSVLSTPPSLDEVGLHYWEGNIVHKFSDDLCLITNGAFQYHLSHCKFEKYNPGDKVYMQVLVTESGGSREVVAVWQLDDVAVPA